MEFTAGKDIDSYCSSCKLVLAHVIIAVGPNRRAKVECKTCRKVHAYKKDPPGTKTTTKTKATPRKSAKKSVENEYEKAIEGRDLSQAKSYKISQTYQVDAIIDHPSFGLGLVQQVLSNNKIEVMFRDGTKILIHAR